MFYRERYTAYLMGVNASLKTTRSSIGGFLAKTAGTITIVDDDGRTIVDAHPVSAGLYYPLPFLLQTETGATVTLAGGASGTLAV